MKLIYYYQTFCGLQDILSSEYKPDIIHVSSIHFGEDYIHLNDKPPDSPDFDPVGVIAKKLLNKGLK